MNTLQILLLAFLMTCGMFITGIVMSVFLRLALVGGMKELLLLYLEKKKEALEELEKKFAKTSGVTVELPSDEQTVSHWDV